MLIQLLRRKRDMNDQAGVSVVELLVGMMLLGLAGALLLGMFMRTSSTVSATTHTNTATSNVSLAMSYLMNTMETAVHPNVNGSVFGHPASIIRAGDPFYYQRAANNNTEATFFATTSEFGVVLVHLYVDTSHRLIRDYIPCGDDCGLWEDFPYAPLETKVLAENIIIPRSGERPIFSWYKLGNDNRVIPDPTIGTLKSADMRDLAGVYISLSSSSQGKVVTAENFQVFPVEALKISSSLRWDITPVPMEATPEPDSDGDDPLGPEPNDDVRVSSDPSTWPTGGWNDGFVPKPNPNIGGIA